MPGLPDTSDDTAMLPSTQNQQTQDVAVYRLHHGLDSPSNVSMSWGRGNKLRISYLQSSPGVPSSSIQDGAGKVVEIRIGSSDTGSNSSQDSVKRRLAYESLPAYAMLQSRKQMLFQSGDARTSAPSDWWETVLDYSRSISAILGSTKNHSGTAVKYSSEVKRETEGPTVLKGIWDLLEVVYVEKNALSWLPEQLVDWLQSYDRVLSRNESAIYSKLVNFQHRLSNMRFPEDDMEYWDSITSALAVGWLDVVVNFLRMHGSYQHDQIDDRQTENGLVEAVAVLISKMPRMRPNSKMDGLGEPHNFKPDFSKAWEKWRKQIAKLNGSFFWSDCTHKGTLSGLKRLLLLLLGDIDTLVEATTHWMELLVSHFLFVRPFSVISEGMLSLARKCVQLKPPSDNDQLSELILAILGENTEVVLAECSTLFDPWMLTHMTELLSARNAHAQALLSEEMDALGGMSLEELHRLVYAQLLSSHPCSWQLAPLYLATCRQLGHGFLQNMLLTQPVSNQRQLAFKVLDICRIYDIRAVSGKIMTVMGMHHWKHGRKGTGISWLQRAHDDRRLSAVAKDLLNMVSQGSCGDSSSPEELEGLIDVLGSDLEGFGGLSFLHSYKDFKVALQKFQEARDKSASSQNVVLAGKEATKCLMQLIKGAAPQQIWFSLLQESVELLEFPDEVLLSETETNVLLMKLQSLSLFVKHSEKDSVFGPIKSLDRVRLALAWNLGRAILKE